MQLTDFITVLQVYNRWKRSFPLILDFNTENIDILNKVGEITLYEDIIYEVIAKGFDGTTTPDVDIINFKATNEDVEEYIPQEILEEYLLLGNEKFIDTSKFLLKYDTLGVVIQDSEYKLAAMAALYLMAHIIYEESYMREQGIGAISKYTKQSRNQSHVAETAKIPSFITNSPILSSYGESQYGVNYLKSIYSRIRGINGFLIQTRNIF